MYHCVLVILGMLKALSEPSRSWLDVPRVYVICSCCYSWHKWIHLWVGCICLVCVLHVLVVTLGMSGPFCEWAVSASSVRCMFLLSLSAWVGPSVSGLYLLRVCVICCCCHSWHEWPICEWAVSASCVRYLLLLSLLAWVDPSVSWLYLPHVCVLSSSCNCRHEWPICEWAVSASSVCYIFLLSLLAWVDPSVSGLYLLWVCVISCCCHSWHEWSHLWVGCICFECVLCVVVVSFGMSGAICEWAISASSVCYMLLLSLSAWVEPSVSGLYLLRVCVICCCCHSRHEWTHLWVGCICFECVLYVVVVTLGMSGPICEWAVSALCVCCMFLLSLSAWVDPSVSWLYLLRVCVISCCCHSWHE